MRKIDHREPLESLALDFFHFIIGLSNFVTIIIKLDEWIEVNWNSRFRKAEWAFHTLRLLSNLDSLLDLYLILVRRYFVYAAKEMAKVARSQLGCQGLVKEWGGLKLLISYFLKQLNLCYFYWSQESLIDFYDFGNNSDRDCFIKGPFRKNFSFPMIKLAYLKFYG